MSNHFKLTENERLQKLPSGQQPIIYSRVGWARTYLKKAGLLEDPRRGYVKITQKGIDVLKENPPVINVKYLNKFPEFIKFRKKRNQQIGSISSDEENVIVSIPPDEMIEKGMEVLNANIAEELLEKINRNKPYFFEK